MKEHLETAPVREAVQGDNTCPICQLRRMIEQQTVERYLGGAVMEPDIRLQTNAVGFCAAHHQRLMAQKDYHGYALMMQTRLRQVSQDIAPAIQQLRGGLFERKRLPAARARVASATSRCLICENTSRTIDRYLDIFMKLYREDSAFRQDFERCAGFCLSDLPQALDHAQSSLSAEQRRSFCATAAAQLERATQTAQADLDALCSSFHYGSEEKNNPRIHQALERAVNLLRGETFEL